MNVYEETVIFRLTKLKRIILWKLRWKVSSHEIQARYCFNAAEQSDGAFGLAKKALPS